MDPYDARIAAARDRGDKLIAQQALHKEKLEKERRAALGTALDEWLIEQSESQRSQIFAGLESKAKGKQLRLIQGHPAKPEPVVKAEKVAETL